MQNPRKLTDIQSEQAALAKLVRTMPLRKVLTVTATMLEDRNDLNAHDMQEFQRRIADLTWPLVGIDEVKQEENASITDLPNFNVDRG